MRVKCAMGAQVKSADLKPVLAASTGKLGLARAKGSEVALRESKAVQRRPCTAENMCRRWSSVHT